MTLARRSRGERLEPVRLNCQARISNLLASRSNTYSAPNADFQDDKYRWVRLWRILAVTIEDDKTINRLTTIVYVKSPCNQGVAADPRTVEPVNLYWKRQHRKGDPPQSGCVAQRNESNPGRRRVGSGIDVSL